MKTFEAQIVNKEEIVLKNQDDMEKLWETIEASGNFILKWTEADNKTRIEKSELFFGGSIVALVSSGDLKIRSAHVVEEQK